MSQHIILLTDVPGLGEIGDERKVKEGFARNYLIPQRLAVFSTSNNKKKFENRKKKIQDEKEVLVTQAKELAAKVTKVGLVFEKPVGEGGKLFGSVTPMDISEELSQHGATVEKRSILMHGPLKSPGEHHIRVRLHSQVVIDVPVKIVGIQANRSLTENEEEEEEAESSKEEAKKETKDKESEEEDAKTE